MAGQIWRLHLVARVYDDLLYRHPSLLIRMIYTNWARFPAEIGFEDAPAWYVDRLVRCWL